MPTEKYSGLQNVTKFHSILNELPQEYELCRNFASSRRGEVQHFFLWTNPYLTQLRILIPGSCPYHAALGCWKASRTVWKRFNFKDMHKSFPEHIPSKDVLKSTAEVLVFIHFFYSSGPNFLISLVPTALEGITQLLCYQPFCPEPCMVWHSLAWYVLMHLDEQIWRSSSSLDTQNLRGYMCIKTL